MVFMNFVVCMADVASEYDIVTKNCGMRRRLLDLQLLVSLVAMSWMIDEVNMEYCWNIN